MALPPRIGETTLQPMDPARQTGRRRGWILAAAALTLLVMLPTRAVASAQDVVNDFRDDGVIVGDFTVTDLQNSKQLFAAQYPPGQLPAIFNQVDNKIAAIFGQKPDDPASTGVPELPSSDAPVWELLVVIAAGLLVLTGVGSSIYRRVRRRAGAG